MNRRGFTLIELLVVISIIALLLSILMPALGLAKQQGLYVTCRTKLKNINLAMRMYAEDNGGKITGGSGEWTQVLPKYYGSEDPQYALGSGGVDEIIAASRAGVSEKIVADEGRKFGEEFKGVWICDAAFKKDRPNCPSRGGKSFAINRFVRWHSDGSAGKILKITDPVNTAETMMFVCAGPFMRDYNGGANKHYWRSVDYNFWYTPGFYHFGSDWQELSPGSNKWLYVDGRENVIFFDGHSEGIKFQDWPTSGGITGNTTANWRVFWEGGL